MGRFKKTALAAFSGIRKRAFYIAEQFTFQKIFRKNGTVYSDKRFPAAAAGVMDTLGEEFFPGTRLAIDQHIGISLAVLLSQMKNEDWEKVKT